MSEFWVRKMRTYFARFDINKDGMVTWQDSQKLTEFFIERRGLNEEQGNDLRRRLEEVWSFGSLDNYDLVLTEDVFVDLMKTRITDPAFNEIFTGPLKLIFSVVDADKDGSISLDELAQLFDGYGLDRSLAEASFEALDTDSDGVISLDEFVENGLAFFTSEDEQSPSRLFVGPLVV